MRNIGIAALVVGMMTWASAMSQIDPDPDSIGVYFDQEANVVSVNAQAYDIVPAYLVATRPSLAGGIVFWEAGVWPNIHEGFEGAIIVADPIGSANYCEVMPGQNGSCISAMPDPAIELQNITLLAELDIYVIRDDIPIKVYITSEVDYSFVGEWGPYEYFYPSSGSPLLPVAVINGEAPIEARGETWGKVKSIYH